MRYTLMILAAAVPLAACAHTETAMVEGDETRRGALAVAAIDRGDLVMAERLLGDSPLDADHPGRLINLGYVYAKQGRTDEAVRTWQRVLASGTPFRVVTMSGREAMTDELARAALARYGARQMAAR